ncbi:MAG: hypothetical protein RL236_751 [Pseudomonadota bacterium]
MFSSFLKKPKVLIMADTPGWIVDRITDEMIRKMKFDFTKRYYSKISTDEFIELANQADLVHYQNWDWIYHKDRINEIKTPIITSIRSFRYPEYIFELSEKVRFHVITPHLKEIFPTATYIPDGIFEPKKRKFVVGFAGRPDKYKGFDMIKKACKELGVVFYPALDIPSEKMSEYYNSIDLYVCASENEGYSAPVMECLSINKPVITTNVGIPSLLNITKIERSVEGIKEGILKFYTEPMVRDYSWDNVCKDFSIFYKSVISKK